MEETSRKLKIRILAYCVMGNHYHLILENSSHRMSDFFLQLNGQYGMIFRKLNGGHGYVFQVTKEKKVKKSSTVPLSFPP